jgi:hypothetical protein
MNYRGPFAIRRHSERFNKKLLLLGLMRKVIIKIKPRLADCDNFFVPGKIRKPLYILRLALRCVMRMNPDGAVNMFISLDKLDNFTILISVSADGNAIAHADRGALIEDFIEIVDKPLISQMRM